MKPLIATLAVVGFLAGVAVPQVAYGQGGSGEKPVKSDTGKKSTKGNKGGGGSGGTGTPPPATKY